MCQNGFVPSAPRNNTTAQQTTLLQVRSAQQAAIVAGLALLGVAVGFAAPAVIGWMQQVDWLPLPAALRIVDGLSSTAGRWILPLIGAVAGTVVGLAILDGLSKIEVSGRSVTIIHGRKKQRFARSQVAEALVDDGHLVLRDKDDADLIREDLDVPAGEVVRALRHHGWPVTA